jgi:superfamily II DNA or RNA helicase
MTKRDLILRDYQIPAAEHALQSPKCVLAIAPSGGKTEISIYVIQEYLIQNPIARVLILTHSTNVLLNNYTDRLDSLNLGFEYSTSYDPNVNVHVCLPHVEYKIDGKYDFIIVDEAHENYFAPRMQRIIKKAKPSKLLLLTGTPAVFIKEGGYDIYAIAANEISSKWFSKLKIELVASDYDWVNYNTQNEVDSSFVFKYNDTVSTMELVMEKLLDRVMTGFNAKEFNYPSFITKLKSWAFTYNKVGKTMIIARNIEQSEMIFRVLNDKGVSCVVSTSENDPESYNMVAFNNNEYDVAIVVNRGRLGYNDLDLFNIIDMSGSNNPNSIYQLMCRVFRGSPDDQKFYLKVTPKDLKFMGATHLSTQLAVQLTDRNFLLQYSGGNLNKYSIPILKNKPKDSSKESEDVVKIKTRVYNKNVNLLEFDYDVVDTFKNVLHDLENPVSIYKMTTIGDVREILGLANKTTWTRDKIIASAMGISIEEYVNIKV